MVETTQIQYKINLKLSYEVIDEFIGKKLDKLYTIKI